MEYEKLAARVHHLRLLVALGASTNLDVRELAGLEAELLKFVLRDDDISRPRLPPPPAVPKPVLPPEEVPTETTPPKKKKKQRPRKDEQRVVTVDV